MKSTDEEDIEGGDNFDDDEDDFGEDEEEKCSDNILVRLTLQVDNWLSWECDGRREEVSKNNPALPQGQCRIIFAYLFCSKRAFYIQVSQIFRPPPLSASCGPISELR